MDNESERKGVLKVGMKNRKFSWNTDLRWLFLSFVKYRLALFCSFISHHSRWYKKDHPIELATIQNPFLGCHSNLKIKILNPRTADYLFIFPFVFPILFFLFLFLHPSSFTFSLLSFPSYCCCCCCGCGPFALYTHFIPTWPLSFISFRYFILHLLIQQRQSLLIQCIKAPFATLPSLDFALLPTCITFIHNGYGFETKDAFFGHFT